MRLATASDEQLMNVRQLDHITRPGADPYRYQPLEEVYPSTKTDPMRHAKFVENTRGSIGAPQVQRPGLARSCSSDPRDRDFRR